VLGIGTVVSQSPRLGRLFCEWNLLSLLNPLVAIACTVIYPGIRTLPVLAPAWVSLALKLPSGRLMLRFLAYTESQRPIRGWGGLSTTLRTVEEHPLVRAGR
jgi:hypothetical protein